MGCHRTLRYFLSHDWRSAVTKIDQRKGKGSARLSQIVAVTEAAKDRFRKATEAKREGRLVETVTSQYWAWLEAANLQREVEERSLIVEQRAVQTLSDQECAERKIESRVCRELQQSKVGKVRDGECIWIRSEER